MSNAPLDQRPWYADVTRYQWTVLLIASLGWVFDVFEGQIFVASMNEAMPSLLDKGTGKGAIAFYNDVALGSFLIGGALGGVLFGMLSDRIGRTRTMVYTILMYSGFTCVSAFAQTWWQLAALRFLVAMGVGGEWAVASAMVAEVFSKRARAWSLGIFHAASVFGTYLAILAGVLVVRNPALGEDGWRWGFAIGALPALLILWIRMSLREPDSWERARTSAKTDATKRLGRISELFSADLRRNTIVGVGLAAVGLATFWGVHIYGKDLVRRNKETEFLLAATPLENPSQRDALVASVIAELLPEDDENTNDSSPKQKTAEQVAKDAEREAAIRNIAPVVGDALLKDDFLQVQRTLLADVQDDQAKALSTVLNQTQTELLRPNNQSIKNWEMLGMLLVTTGGGIGLISFGPLSERFGRRGAFLMFHLGGAAIAVALFQVPALHEMTPLLCVLPVFGYLTLGMHAGYAIYFPELFPTRLRGTGGGFCFNFGRILAAPILLLRGWMLRDWGFTLDDAVALLSLLFLIGAFLLLIAPETRGEDLPE